MIYAYASITVTNPASLDQYREKAQQALAKHGGEVIVASGEVTPLDGVPNQPDIAVLLSFPDKDAALGWANDPDLQDTHALRRGAGTSDILLIG